MNSKPWYPVPFEKGKEYAATTDILGHFDRITNGERLIYRDTGFSRYDGYIGFFFTDTNGNDRRWDMYEDLDPVAEAKKAFVKCNPTS